MKLIGKVVIVAVLLVIIGIAFHWRQAQIKRLEDNVKSSPTDISRVASGAIVVDGVGHEWANLSRYNLGKYRSASAGQMGWDQVRLAHDGTWLYVLISVDADVEQAISSGAAMGIFYIDADGNPDTGQEDTDGKAKFGFDVGVHLMSGGTKGGGEKSSPGLSYVLARCTRKASQLDMKSRVSSAEHPDQIAFGGQCVEMKIPLSALGIKVPAVTAFSFQPAGVGDYVIYDGLKVK